MSVVPVDSMELQQSDSLTPSKKDVAEATAHSGNPRLVCQACGTDAFLVPACSLPEATLPPQKDEAEMEAEITAADASENRPKSSRSRIGRLFTDQYQNEQLVDHSEYVDRDTATDSFANYVFAIKHEKVISPEGLERKVGNLVLLSSPLAEAYHSVVKGFERRNLGPLIGRKTSIPEPYAALFYYHDEIADAAKRHGMGCYEDFEVFSKYYQDNILPEHNRIRLLLSEGMVLYEDLWAIYRPGDLVFGVQDYGEPSVNKLVNIKYQGENRLEGSASRSTNPGPSGGLQVPRMAVGHSWFIKWDNSSGTFGRQTKRWSISEYTGTREISSLCFYPLRYYKGGKQHEIETLLNNLGERGRKWRVLMCERPACFDYKGQASELSCKEDVHVSLYTSLPSGIWLTGFISWKNVL